MIAVVGRDTNLSTARTPSQLELNYLTTADDLAQMIADGTFPPPRHPGETTSRAPGRRRPGPARRRRQGHLRQPERAVRVPPARLRRAPGRRGPGRADTAGWPTTRWRATDAANGILAALRGEAPPRREIDARGATVLHPGAAADAGRGADRRAGAGPRHHRGPPPGPGADHQGRHHPGDPPPGEEQPADRRRAAAAAGPPGRPSPDARAALEESVRRVASIALVHETLSMSSDEAVEFDGIVDRVASAADRGRRAPSRACGMRRAGQLRRAARRDRHLAGDGPQRVAAQRRRARLRPGAPAGRAAGEVVVSAHRFRKQLHVTRRRQRPRPAGGLRRRTRRPAGPADRPGAGHRELRGTIELRTGPTAAPRRCSSCRWPKPRR